MICVCGYGGAHTLLTANNDAILLQRSCVLSIHRKRVGFLSCLTVDSVLSDYGYALHVAWWVESEIDFVRKSELEMGAEVCCASETLAFNQVLDETERRISR